jgi:hypothetical protein
MAPKKKKQEETKVKYFTMPPEKFFELVAENERFRHLVSQRLKELAEFPVESWFESPIADFAEAFYLADRLKEFLEDKINNPTEEEIEFIEKNKIEEVLISQDELRYMQVTAVNLQEIKESLFQQYSFSTTIN